MSPNHYNFLLHALGILMILAATFVDAHRITFKSFASRVERKHQRPPVVAPEFVVDLRKPPEERWLEVVSHFREPMNRVFTKMVAEILPAIGRVGEFFFDPLTSFTYPEHLKSEICAIATEVGVQCNHLKIIQLAYELHAACTSIGAILPGGAKLFRTMDWDLTMLEELSATFRFIGDDFDFTASSWAGYVGVLTGVRAAGKSSDGLAISVNFRRRVEHPVSFGVIWGKVTGIITGAEPVGFLLRRVLGSKAFSNYESAIAELSERRLVAPVYFTVAGVRLAMQEVLKRYAEDYIANYDPSEVMCCCSARPTKCALVGKSDFQDYECPIMAFEESDNSTQTFENKAGCAKRPTLVAPCAMHSTEIAVITRDVAESEEVRTLTSTTVGSTCRPAQSEQTFLVQTNHDQFAPIVDGVPLSPDGASQDIFDSLARKERAEKYLDGMRQTPKATDVNEYAFNVLSLTKVMNSHTVYGTFMDPIDGTLETRLPGTCPGGNGRSRNKKNRPTCGDGKRTFAYRSV